MRTILEQRIEDFVDRMAELQGFSAFTESEEKLILLVRGPTGMGKSSLLAKIRRECEKKELRHVAIDCEEISLNTYHQVMCRVRDELKKPELFQDFTRLTQSFEAPRISINVGQEIEKIEPGGSAIGVKIDTLNLSGPASAGVPEAERMVRLTEQFVGSLERVAQGVGLVVLLDETHKMTSETTLWLWAQLLKSLLENRLAAVRFVVAVRDRPQMDRYMSNIVEDVELKPLAMVDVVEYLKLRRIGQSDDERRQVALGLYASTRGNPMSVATAVDTLNELLRKMASTNG
jgi:Cdc6-like AAA superfamily ATPase